MTKQITKAELINLATKTARITELLSGKGASYTVLRGASTVEQHEHGARMIRGDRAYTDEEYVMETPAQMFRAGYIDFVQFAKRPLEFVVDRAELGADLDAVEAVVRLQDEIRREGATTRLAVRAPDSLSMPDSGDVVEARVAQTGRRVRMEISAITVYPRRRVGWVWLTAIEFTATAQT